MHIISIPRFLRRCKYRTTGEEEGLKECTDCLSEMLALLEYQQGPAKRIRVLDTIFETLNTAAFRQMIAQHPTFAQTVIRKCEEFAPKYKYSEQVAFREVQAFTKRVCRQNAEAEP